MEKYCAKCDQIFSARANYCSWCGQDIAKYKEYPDFETWEQRQKIYEQMKRDALQGTNIKEEYKIVINQQLSLF